MKPLPLIAVLLMAVVAHAEPAKDTATKVLDETAAVLKTIKSVDDVKAAEPKLKALNDRLRGIGKSDEIDDETARLKLLTALFAEIRAGRQKVMAEFKRIDALSKPAGDAVLAALEMDREELARYEIPDFSTPEGQQQLKQQIRLRDSVMSALNLSKLGAACLIYSGENNGNYPPDFETLITKVPDAKAELFKRPGSKSKLPANADKLTPAQVAAWVKANNDYLYLGKGKTIRSGDAEILAVENPDVVTEGDLQALFADGRAEAVKREEAMKQIRK